MKRPSVFRWGKNIDELRELADKGWYLQQLANHFGCHHTTVLYQLKKYGITLSTVPRSKKNGPKQLRTQKQRVMAGHCPICYMLLASKYHQAYPCETNE